MLKRLKQVLALGRAEFATTKTQKLFEERIDKLVQTIR